jgi:hypothetical protein
MFLYTLVANASGKHWQSQVHKTYCFPVPVVNKGGGGSIRHILSSSKYSQSKYFAWFLLNCDHPNKSVFTIQRKLSEKFRQQNFSGPYKSWKHSSVSYTLSLDYFIHIEYFWLDWCQSSLTPYVLKCRNETNFLSHFLCLAPNNMFLQLLNKHKLTRFLRRCSYNTTVKAGYNNIKMSNIWAVIKLLEKVDI